MSTLLYFPIWWYVKNFSFWFKFVTRTLRLLIDALGIGPILRHFFSPYRGDRTLVGFGVGIGVRLVWIIASVPLVLCALLVLLSVLALYLSLPLALLAALKEMSEGYFVLGSLYFVIFIFSVWLYWRNYVRQPRMTIDQLMANRVTEANAKDEPLQLQKPVLDIEEVMTPTARNLWRRFKEKHFKPDLTIGDVGDLVRVLFKTDRLQKILLRLNFSEERKNKFLNKLDQLRMVHIQRSLSVLADSILSTGQKFAHKYVDVDLVFLSLLRETPQLEKALKEEEIAVSELFETIVWVEEKEKRRQSYRFWEDQFFHSHGGGTGGWVAGFVPTLKHFSVDITTQIRRGQLPIIVGRENEVEEIVRILSRTTQNNVLLLGPPGVGKTSIVYAIAQRLLSGELTGKLAEKKVLSLDVGAMLAGATLVGQLEARIKQALKELAGSNAILFVDEIDNFVQRGAEYFLPSLSEGRIQFIGTATPEAYKRLIEPNSVFASYFQVVRIEEPNTEESIEILEALSSRIEKDQKVTISYPALEAAVRFSQRYQSNHVLPDKAVDLLDETAVWAKKKAKGKSQNSKVTVTAEDIATVLSEKIGIPLTELTMEESGRLLHLEEILHQRIVGQEEAISAIANAMRRARTGLVSERRPIASFLFIGPTGVGKTETSKVLAESYFGSSERMIRMDMSEFAEHGSVVNFTDRLCDRVREVPFAVLLLDEIEKAEVDIHNLLLQVLDEGRLTDSRGKRANFTNTLIIGTSNAFSGFIMESLKKQVSMEEIQNKLLNNLQKVFAPEFLNRFDGIIVFKSLTSDQLEEITQLLLKEVLDRLLKQEILLEFSNEVVAEVASLGFDRSLGARPLRRVIQEKIEDPLAKKILEGKIKAGQKVKIEKLPIF